MSYITTREAICNRALSLLKANTVINNLTNDVSYEANLCKKNVDEAMDFLLGMHRWSFATYRTNLATANESIAYEYDYAFQLPTDPYCLDVMEVVDVEGLPIDDWKVEGRYILCNEEDIYIKYIGRVVEVANCSMLFRNAWVFYLAMLLAEPLLHSDQVAAKMERQFVRAIKKAIRLDAKQGSVKEEDRTDYSWASARNS
jgi:hypothetical protein